jgi:hypothetical protein
MAILLARILFGLVIDQCPYSGGAGLRPMPPGLPYGKRYNNLGDYGEYPQCENLFPVSGREADMAVTGRNLCV